MSLPGQGFLAIWNEVVAAEEAEWVHWHTVEHMPERVGVPGFLGGRRYIDTTRSPARFFTLYLGEALTTFNGAPYLERLNNPTPWTSRMSPHFRNFLRGACRSVASVGRGQGGAIATVRVLPQAGVALDEARVHALAERIGARRGIVGAHVGLADAAVTSVPTRERSMRGATVEPVFHGVVMIEALAMTDLEAALPDIGAEIVAAQCGLVPAETGVFALHFSLAKSDLA